MSRHGRDWGEGDYRPSPPLTIDQQAAIVGGAVGLAWVALFALLVILL